MTTAREIMTESARCVREDQAVLAAAQKLTQLGVSAPADLRY